MSALFSTMSKQQPFPIHHAVICFAAIALSHLPATAKSAENSPHTIAPAPSGADSKVALETKEIATPVTQESVKQAINRGLTFLISSQDPSGWWSTKDQPGLTALVLTAFNMDPTGSFRKSHASELKKAFDFILTSAQPDGSIHRGALINYNTALSLMALSTAYDPNYLPVIRAARTYIAGSQMNPDGNLESPFDGGVGYGSKYDHSDLNNTLVALEAMRWSDSAEQARPEVRAVPVPTKDLNWAAAIHFVQNCQNLASKNPAEWVSKRPEDKGGFVYYPGLSYGGEDKDEATGKTTLRSYGSMSYAGLLSYLYAKLDPSDERVGAVLDWSAKNYTLEENPGMGLQGYYYYLHLMAKALTAANIDQLELADGRKVDWRQEIAARILSLQQENGSWVNTEKRWWEVDPNLVTTYSVLALEILYPDLAPKSRVQAGNSKKP